MKIYLSGPITNDARYKENFKNAANRLRRLGHKVLDPTIWERDGLRLSYEDYMALDLGMLEVCDAIYMMSGWADSKGARQELDRAVELGLEVYYADQNKIPAVPKVYKRNEKYGWC